MARVQIKRIYDAPEKSDGLRVLVDRLWPRGISKKAAALDLWMKELAPSTELRKWFNHDPAAVGRTFACATAANCANTARNSQALKAQAAKRRVTLLFGARDTVHNEAVVLREALQPK